jgi:hypothetical protein
MAEEENEGIRGGKPFYSDRGNGRGSSDSSTQSKTSQAGYKTGSTKKRKVLADYVYEISSTSAQDYPLITKYNILNEIQDTYKEGHHVVESIKKGVILTFDEQVAAAMIQVQEQLNRTDAKSTTATSTRSKTTVSEDLKEQTANRLLDIKLKSIEYSGELYTTNMFKAYAMIWTQCSKVMQTNISNTSNFEPEINNNPIKLLNIIRAYCIKMQERE